MNIQDKKDVNYDIKKVKCGGQSKNTEFQYMFVKLLSTGEINRHPDPENPQRIPNKMNLKKRT